MADQNNELPNLPSDHPILIRFHHEVMMTDNHRVALCNFFRTILQFFENHNIDRSQYHNIDIAQDRLMLYFASPAMQDLATNGPDRFSNDVLTEILTGISEILNSNSQYNHIFAFNLPPEIPNNPLPVPDIPDNHPLLIRFRDEVMLKNNHPDAFQEFIFDVRHQFGLRHQSMDDNPLLNFFETPAIRQLRDSHTENRYSNEILTGILTTMSNIIGNQPRYRQLFEEPTVNVRVRPSNLDAFRNAELERRRQELQDALKSIPPPYVPRDIRGQDPSNDMTKYCRISQKIRYDQTHDGNFFAEDDIFEEYYNMHPLFRTFRRGPPDPRFQPPEDINAIPNIINNILPPRRSPVQQENFMHLPLPIQVSDRNAQHEYSTDNVINIHDRGNENNLPGYDFGNDDDLAADLESLFKEYNSDDFIDVHKKDKKNENKVDENAEKAEDNNTNSDTIPEQQNRRFVPPHRRRIVGCFSFCCNII